MSLRPPLGCVERRSGQEAALSSPDLSYLKGHPVLPGLELGRRYSDAPIAQALVEFHVRPGVNVKLDALADLDFGDHFSPPDPISAFDHVVDDETGDTRPEEYEAGFSFALPDEAVRIHATADRYAFISRRQYDGWEAFIAEVEAAWLTYRAAVAPVEIEMIGVRFTNHIQLPNKPVELKDYLRTGIELSSYLPQAVSSMFMQVEVPLTDYDSNATITSALLPPTADHPGGGVLLDIDIKSDVRITTHAEDFDAVLRARLDMLRLAKNFVFEACITDATRGLIDNGG